MKEYIKQIESLRIFIYLYITVILFNKNYRNNSCYNNSCFNKNN